MWLQGYPIPEVRTSQHVMSGFLKINKPIELHFFEFPCLLPSIIEERNQFFLMSGEDYNREHLCQEFFPFLLKILPLV